MAAVGGMKPALMHGRLQRESFANPMHRCPLARVRPCILRLARPQPDAHMSCHTVRRSTRVAGGARNAVYTQLVKQLDKPAEGFGSIQNALAELAAGKFVVVLDDEDRENEGDLIINADKMTTEAMAFMVEQTSGVICISMEGHDMERLKLPLMVSSTDNDESMYTAFTITIDFKEGCTTGISAADRSATIRAMADPSSSPEQFRRPGHIFPLRYRTGGTIVRPGHTEAALDLARLSGSYPAGVLCEIVDKRDGSMARTPQLIAFAKQHNLAIITIADLIRYRLRHDQLLKHAAAVPLDTRAGPFTAHCFKSLIDGSEHVALVAGSVTQGAEVPVRMQEQNPLVDVFGSTHCGAQSYLDRSMETVAAAGQGVVLYVKAHGSEQHESLLSQLQSHQRQQEHCSTSSSGSGSSSSSSSPGAAFSDLRDYATAAHMLRHLGVTSVQLLSHSEADSEQLRAFGVAVAPSGGSQWTSSSSSSLQGAEVQPHALGNGSSGRTAAAVS